MVKWRSRTPALVAAAGLALGGCGGDDEPDSGDGGAGASASGKPVTIDWWHIQNNDPMKSVWREAADAYMAEHPNVTVKITVLENEAFKTKLTTTMQAGNVPDVFQSWGGGTLAEQADAGLV